MTGSIQSQAATVSTHRRVSSHDETVRHRQPTTRGGARNSEGPWRRSRPRCASNEIAKAVVVALLRAGRPTPRGPIGSQSRRDDNSRGKVQNVRGDSSAGRHGATAIVDAPMERRRVTRITLDDRCLPDHLSADVIQCSWDGTSMRSHTSRGLRQPSDANAVAAEDRNRAVHQVLGNPRQIGQQRSACSAALRGEQWRKRMTDGRCASAASASRRNRYPPS
jgi:hypothetical protein